MGERTMSVRQGSGRPVGERPVRRSAAALIVPVTLGVALLAGCGGGGSAPVATPTAASSTSTSAAVEPVASGSGTTAPGGPGPTTPGADSPGATAGRVARSAGSAGAADASGAPAVGATSGTIRVPVVGVVDGDTIRVRVAGRTERVRVIGIDTPELRGEECGAQRAASRMQSLVQSRSVTLVPDPTQDDRDRYGRLLRHLRLDDGRSVAQILLAEGLGREYTYRRAYEGQASHRAAEDAAREASAGLWGACPSSQASGPRPSGPRTSAPRAVTGSSPDAAKPDAGTAGGCRIKGNISSEGEKIYHVPGGRSYERTKISPGRGERMFCSEAQAREAGWRAARD